MFCQLFKVPTTNDVQDLCWIVVYPVYEWRNQQKIPPAKSENDLKNSNFIWSLKKSLKLRQN